MFLTNNDNYIISEEGLLKMEEKEKKEKEVSEEESQYSIEYNITNEEEKDDDIEMHNLYDKIKDFFKRKDDKIIQETKDGKIIESSSSPAKQVSIIGEEIEILYGKKKFSLTNEAWQIEEGNTQWGGPYEEPYKKEDYEKILKEFNNAFDEIKKQEEKLKEEKEVSKKNKKKEKKDDDIGMSNLSDKIKDFFKRKDDKTIDKIKKQEEKLKEEEIKEEEKEERTVEFKQNEINSINNKEKEEVSEKEEESQYSIEYNITNEKEKDDLSPLEDKYEEIKKQEEKLKEEEIKEEEKEERTVEFKQNEINSINNKEKEEVSEKEEESQYSIEYNITNEKEKDDLSPLEDKYDEIKKQEEKKIEEKCYNHHKQKKFEQIIKSCTERGSVDVKKCISIIAKQYYGCEDAEKKLLLNIIKKKNLKAINIPKNIKIEQYEDKDAFGNTTKHPRNNIYGRLKCSKESNPQKILDILNSV